jgi:sporulation protein YlmC with PRC-barrel domain
MLFAASALQGYSIEATDGKLGSVSDLLVDDHSWKVRWLVVDTGHWLSGRKVLVHPSAVKSMDIERRVLPVALTKVQVEESPSLSTDEPVSRQMEGSLFNYYGYDPYWGGSYFGGAMDPSPMPYGANAGIAAAQREAELGDPQLRSAAALTGYHMHATDGGIGHLDNLMIDDESWGVRYLVVDTKNWWPGKHVIISPYAIRRIEWSGHQIVLDVSREQVKGSPEWDPAGAIDRLYEKQLHGYYGWPGYGF